MNTYSDDRVESAVAADLAERAVTAEYGVEPVPVGDGRHLIRMLHRDGDRTIQTLLDPDDYAPQPRYKTGTVATHTIGSFIRYVRKHVAPGTEVYVDQRTGKFVAVIDDHIPGEDTSAHNLAGWGRHRAECALAPTKDWQHWIGADGRLVPQLTFADHVEQGLHNIIDPPAADFLEICQTLTGHRNVSWKSGARVDNGQIQLSYIEQIQGNAGPAGNLEIPQRFALALEPFEGAPPIRLEASFRWRLNDGNVTLGYRLVRPDDARKASIDALIDQIENDDDGLGIAVILGTPRAGR